MALQMLWLIDGLKIARLPMLRSVFILVDAVEFPATDQHQPMANYGASDAMADRWSEDSNASGAPGRSRWSPNH